MRTRPSHLRDDFGPGQGGIAGPLFQERQKAFPDRAPIAAAADPETSHEAAHELTASGRRDAQKKVVLRCLEGTRGGPMTSAEFAAFFGLDRHMVARRLPDLEADSLVRRSGKRPCRITGHDAITWEAGRG